MKKTWIRIIIVAFVIMVIEIVGSIILLKPYITRYQVFDTIKNGQWQKTQEYYDELSDNGKEYVLDNLDSYAAWISEQYLKGEYTYNELAASMDAINSIGDSHEVYNKYMPLAAENELKASIIAYYEASVSRDNERLFEVQTTMTSLMQRMDSDTREQIMVEFLTMEYEKFLKGEISSVDMKTYAEIVVGMTYYEAYDLGHVIIANTSHITAYRDAYNQAVQYTDEEKYKEALEIIDSTVLDPNDQTYIDKYAELRGNVITLGSIYYEDLIQSYVDAGDMETAMTLMDELKPVYGDAIDFADIEDSIADDWQYAYLTVLRDLDKNLISCVEETNYTDYVLGEKKDSIWPDSVFLYDVDGDDIPELFLFNSARLEDDYVPCFMYTSLDHLAAYVDFFNLRSLCEDSCLITSPIADGRTEGEEYQLLSYANTLLSSEMKCQYIDGVYYVNGEESTDVEYLSVKTDIMEHQSVDSIEFLGYTSVDKANSYILTYSIEDKTETEEQ